MSSIDATTGADVRKRSLFMIVLISLSGTTIEWYDFFIYGNAAALVFPRLFFPKFDPLVGTLLSFATFGVAFVARPVGGMFFGHLGDRIGRKRTLFISLIMMGCGTMLIGALPGYTTIGVSAPILLVALRIIQGFAVGGMWGGAVLVATENAPTNRRGLYSSFATLGASAGIIIANIVFLFFSATLSPAAFLAWGWRVPFLLSFLLIGVGLLVQMRLEETATFERVRQNGSQHQIPLLSVLRKYPKEILLGTGALLMPFVSYYVIITYMLSYGKIIGIPGTTLLTVVLVSSVIAIFATMGAALLSDIIGRRTVYMTGVLLLALWTFPMFWLINSKAVASIYIAIIVAQVFWSMLNGPVGVLLSEIFTPELRYSGASLIYQLGAILGGGFAPIIASALYASAKSSTPIAIYMMIIGAISLLTIFFLSETYKRNFHAIEGEEVAAAVS